MKKEYDEKLIRYYRKNVYGNENFYAVDHVDAISTLTSRKTLLKNDMKALEQLGFEFKEVLQAEVK